MGQIDSTPVNPCPLCQMVEEAYTDFTRRFPQPRGKKPGSNSKRREVSTMEGMAWSNVLALKGAHPCCPECGLLFGVTHLGRSVHGVCQFCAREKKR